ncbi:transmembrane channel-like protein 7 [Onthophagus taurus]|uniref:transmembrane channel-like protein 7 n=1 Tax=Onthophagus taurus TaxID=166361 RepID=UPI0039BEADD6
MSGGGNRKKNNKIQGWEDAGVEFYQENYLSNEVELQEVLRKDPKHLATLLPSKQNRAYSTMRMHCTDTKSRTVRTVRRQTTTRSWRRENTGRRPSVAAEVQVAMLPDLSEPISNEQTAWEQVMRIKELPIPMAEKKLMKMKIQSSPNLRLQGYEQFKWKRRKLFQRFNQNFDELWSKLELWHNDMKQMEGNFGTGIVAYLLFIKWLLFFNLTISIVIFIFVILPLIIGPTQEVTCDKPFDKNNTDCCLSSYLNSTNFKDDVISVIQDLVQGTGRLEYTPFFYGNYTHKNIPYTIFNIKMYYFLPLAYVSITILILLYSLFSVIKEAAKCFRFKIIEGEGQFYKYSNLAFASWDFCIHNEKAAQIKKKAIFNETKSNLEVERLREEKKNRTKQENAKISVIRLVINLFEIAILALCAWLIYIVFEFSSQKLSKKLTEIEKLFFEFLPSICIVIMNLLIPVLFRYLVVYEKYSPGFTISIILIRTIFLRLSSIIVLYGSMYSIIITNNKMENCFANEYKCWETFIGQHIYRLALTDFATHLIITFLINLPRAILEKSTNNKFIKFIGEQHFDLPKNVLDIVYMQTLCWLGTFYTPFLPVIYVIILFFMFYVKKFVITVNSKPCKMIHRASTSNFMFMNMLLISFIVAVFPVAYTIGELKPSESCGPFRGLNTAWEIVERTLESTPEIIRNSLRYLTTAAVTVPLFIILILLLYYYAAVNNANRHMVRVLKDQLVLEGHDKQFLLERLSQFIRQQQETQKQLRHVDGDVNISSH